MTYRLFIDDIRDPLKVYPGETDWVVCRDYDEAVAAVNRRGWPVTVSFDHDLGESTDKTGYDFAKWLVERDINQGDMPANFAYAVHSANPVGAANIRGLLDNYLRFRNG